MKAPSVSTPGYRETRAARLSTSRSASPRVTLAALPASRWLPAVSAHGQRGGFTAPTSRRGAPRTARSRGPRDLRSLATCAGRVRRNTRPFQSRPEPHTSPTDSLTRPRDSLARSSTGRLASLSFRALGHSVPEDLARYRRGTRPRQRAPGLTVQVGRPLSCCSSPRGLNSHPKTTPSEVQAASVRRSDRDSATAKESVLTSPRSVPPVSAMARYWRVTAPRKYALRPCNTAAMAST